MTDQPRKRAAKPPAHDVTVTDMNDSPVAQGGVITVRCVCGWSQWVRYERDRLADAVSASMLELGGEHIAGTSKTTSEGDGD